MKGLNSVEKVCCTLQHNGGSKPEAAWLMLRWLLGPTAAQL